MSDVFATFIVPAGKAERARRIAGALSPGGVGMWMRGASPTGQPPATHYVSSGWVSEQFVPPTKDGALLHAAAQQAKDPATRAECDELVALCDVSHGRRAAVGEDGIEREVDETPHERLERMGLKLLPR